MALRPLNKNGRGTGGTVTRPTSLKQPQFTSVAEIRQRFLAECDNARPAGASQWDCRCPAHDDNRNSLSVSEGDEGLLLHCHAGCSPEDVVKALGWTLRDLFANDRPPFATELKAHRAATPKPAAEPQPKSNGRSKIVKTYDYRDESGKLLYQACRMEPKDFRQRRPKDGGGWEWTMKDVRKVLYRLPDLVAASADVPVFIVEGEKDADRLASLDDDTVATTNVGGAGKWRPEYCEPLRGRHVIILPDNDEPGRKHADQVARALHGIAKSIRVVELPGLPPKGDVSDYLDGGGTPDGLLDLVAAAKPWTPGDAQAAADAPAGSLDVVELDKVEPRPVEWLWPGFLPRGVIIDLSGDPGNGKTTLMIDVAARLTRGFRMPPGPPVKIGGGHSAGVLFLSAEDDWDRTVKPRLQAANANLSRVAGVTTFTGQDGMQRPVALPHDLPYIERLILERKIGLVVIDPIMAFIGDGIDTHTDHDVRRALFPLKQLAETSGAAIVAIRHLNKKAGGNALYRGGGSIAFTAVARTGLVLGTDPNNEETRVLAVAKSNLGPKPRSLAFNLNQAEIPSKAGAIATSVVSWNGECDLEANDIIDHAPQRQTKQDDAGDAIEAALANGPLPAKDLERAIVNQMFSGMTFKRSRKRLQDAGRIVGGKEGMKGGWHWRLADQKFPWEKE